jgi:O-antigen/teichoic acid export membrane protein
MHDRLPPSDQDELPRLGWAWLSLPYLFLSFLALCLFTMWGMSAARGEGRDPRLTGALVCTLGAVAGLIAFVRMLKRKGGRNFKTARVATLAGALIFFLGAGVLIFNNGADQAGRKPAPMAAQP